MYYKEFKGGEEKRKNRLRRFLDVSTEDISKAKKKLVKWLLDKI